MKRILFTSVGQHYWTLEHLSSIAHGLQHELGEEIDFLTADSDGRVGGLQFGNPVVLTRFDSPYAAADLVELCLREKPCALIPMSDNEFDLLGQVRRELEGLGVKVLLPAEETVELCRNKYAFAQRLKATGWPHPGTQLLSEVVPYQLNYPVFLKDIDSSQSRGNYYQVNRVAELLRLKEFLVERKDGAGIAGKIVVQPYVAMPQYWAQLVVSEAGQLLAVATAKSALTRAWTDWVYTTPFHPELLPWYQRVIDEFKLAGPVVVDFWWDGSGPPLLGEINTRMGTHWCMIGAMHASEPDGVGTALLKLALDVPMVRKDPPHREIVCHVVPDVVLSDTEKWPEWRRWENRSWTV